MLQVNLNPFPILETDRLLLRRIVAEDIKELFFMRSDPGMMEYIKKPLCQREEEALEFLERIETGISTNTGINWGITLKGQAAIIGTVSIWRIDREHYRGEVGYALMPQYQGSGIMREALSTVINWGFSIGLHTLEANIDPGNTASRRVLESLGFEQDAYRKEDYYYDGHFYDTASFSLIEPTPPKQ